MMISLDTSDYHYYFLTYIKRLSALYQCWCLTKLMINLSNPYYIVLILRLGKNKLIILNELT